MRIVEFKGKLKTNNEWSYGNLCNRVDDKYIITPDDTPLGKYGAVISETISQYTNINDIEDNRIYENDILELSEEGRKLFGSEGYPCRKYQLVGFKDGCFMTGRCSLSVSDHLDTYLWIIKDYVKVVGNKFDNPELLNEED